MDIRLVPMEHATQRLPRIARDVARDNDKTSISTSKVTTLSWTAASFRKLGDPLMHWFGMRLTTVLSRQMNGKRKGKMRKERCRFALAETDYVSVIVEDDGAGIDADRVREEAVNRDLFTREQANQLSDEQCFELLFRPGFSTKDEVTETSGRGLGWTLRIRPSAVDKDIEVHSSEPDVGTQVRIQLPVSLGNFADAVHRSWRR